MQEIPLQPISSQSTKVVLDGQNCQLLVYQKPQGIFVDINVDGVDLVVGVIARDAVPLMCREYEGFAGNLMFIDTQGGSDPSYEGVGSRFNLVYLTADEYALIQ
jgi:hypothetical protein